MSLESKCPQNESPRAPQGSPGRGRHCAVDKGPPCGGPSAESPPEISPPDCRAPCWPGAHYTGGLSGSGHGPSGPPSHVAGSPLAEGELRGAGDLGDGPGAWPRAVSGLGSELHPLGDTDGCSRPPRSQLGAPSLSPPPARTRVKAL